MAWKEYTAVGRKVEMTIFNGHNFMGSGYGPLVKYETPTEKVKEQQNVQVSPTTPIFHNKHFRCLFILGLIVIFPLKFGPNL